MKYTFILLFSFFSSVIYAQNGAVVGKITDSDNGLPLPGANIILKGTDYGTISDVSEILFYLMLYQVIIP